MLQRQFYKYFNLAKNQACISSRRFSSRTNMAFVNANKFSSEESRAFFDSFDTILTDCDGVLWHGNDPIPGSPEMINKFRQMGKRVIFVTNNSTKSRKDFAVKCQQLGFGGSIEEFYSTSFLVASYLKSKNFDKKVYLFGGKGIVDELDTVGIPHLGFGPDPVDSPWSIEYVNKATKEMDPDVGCVVASIDYYVSYVKMLKAISYLDKPEILFVATNMDERFPFRDNIVLPGTGSLIATLVTASGRQPVIMGKPEKFMFEAVQRDFPEIKPERTLMIGDNTKTDIMLGKNCGLRTLMVGTGVESLHDVKKWAEDSAASTELKLRVADFSIEKLGDLLTFT